MPSTSCRTSLRQTTLLSGESTLSRPRKARRRRPGVRQRPPPHAVPARRPEPAPRQPPWRGPPSSAPSPSLLARFARRRPMVIRDLHGRNPDRRCHPLIAWSTFPTDFEQGALLQVAAELKAQVGIVHGCKRTSVARTRSRASRTSSSARRSRRAPTAFAATPRPGGRRSCAASHGRRSARSGFPTFNGSRATHIAGTTYAWHRFPDPPALSQPW